MTWCIEDVIVLIYVCTSTTVKPSYNIFGNI